MKKYLSTVFLILGALSLGAWRPSPFNGGGGGSSGSGSTSIGGTVTSGTQGSVLFLGGSGVLAQNNANFFWDNTNLRLGIGTATPSYNISISTDISNGSASMRISNGNNSNAYSDARLEIATGGGSGGDPSLFFQVGATYQMVEGLDTSDSGKFKIAKSTFVGGANTYFTLDTSGNVGIGTQNPATKLHLSSGVFTIDGTGGALNIGGTTGVIQAPTGAALSLQVGTSTGAMVYASSGTMNLDYTDTAHTLIRYDNFPFNTPSFGVANSTYSFSSSSTTMPFFSQWEFDNALGTTTTAGNGCVYLWNVPSTFSTSTAVTMTYFSDFPKAVDASSVTYHVLLSTCVPYNEQVPIVVTITGASGTRVDKPRVVTNTAMTSWNTTAAAGVPNYVIVRRLGNSTSLDPSTTNSYSGPINLRCAIKSQ